MDDTSSAFAPWHRHDRRFFLTFVIVAWLLILTGFAPAVIMRFTGSARYVAPWSLIIHVWSFTGWMCLLTLQVMLVRKQRTELHRLTGMAMLALLPVMLVSGFMAEVFTRRFTFAVEGSVSKTIFPMSFLLVFAVAATLAFIKRGNSPAHKRLIIVSTSTILAAATNRLITIAMVVARGKEAGLAFFADHVGTIFWAGPIVLVVAAAMYDRLTRGRVHPVLSTGLTALILVYLLTNAMNQSEWWPPMAQRLLGL